MKKNIMNLMALHGLEDTIGLGEQIKMAYIQTKETMGILVNYS